MPEDVKDDPPEAPTSSSPARSREDKAAEIVSQIIGMTFMLAIVGSFFAPVRQFFLAYWKLLVPGAIGIVLVVISWGTLRQRMRQSVRTKVGAIVALLAVLSIIEGLIGILPTRYQILALRSILLMTACLFPSLLYYLFITTRKDSLCTEFFTNLERLGLLAPGHLPSRDESGIRHPETETSRRLRLLTYVQKFEATYGPLDPKLVDDIVSGAHADPRAAFLTPSTDDRPRRSAAVFTPEAAAPMVLCTTLIALGWIIALPPWQQQLSLPTSSPAAAAGPMTWVWALYPDASPVYYAFLGAYFFGIQMLFRRYVLKDLRTSAYASVSLRILLAIMATWVLLPAAEALGYTNIKNDDSRLLVIAFVIGFFPPVIWQFIQALFKKITFARVILPSTEAQIPLSELDGLTIWHEARLQEEDIENVPNMATASLVDLMLNTRFSPDRIVDWVDQAILYTNLGPEAEDTKPSEQRRARLRTHGIRGASALVATYEWSRGVDQEAFEKILPAEQRSTIRTLVHTVVTNPNLAMILAWRRLAPLVKVETALAEHYASLGIVPVTAPPPHSRPVPSGTPAEA